MPSRPRTPPQGGLPPAPEVVEGVVEGLVHVACDESGFSGTNVLDPATPLFTHASTDLDVAQAGALVAELRSGLRWSGAELKSGPLLRGTDAARARSRLLSALRDGSGTRAHVLLVDKGFFLATRVVELFHGVSSYAAVTASSPETRQSARDLHRASRRSPEEWRTFLEAFVALARTKRRRAGDDLVVQRLLRARAGLVEALAGSPPPALVALSPQRVQDALDRLHSGDPDVPPPLEPLIPALAGTVLHWSRGRRAVLVTHDEQSALTAPRLRRLQLALPHLSGPDGSRRPVLAGLLSVDSRDDPRVQVADILAAVARRTPDPGRDPGLAPFLSDDCPWDPAG